jgi:hypothetical protein
MRGAGGEVSVGSLSLCCKLVGLTAINPVPPSSSVYSTVAGADLRESSSAPVERLAPSVQDELIAGGARQRGRDRGEEEGGRSREN